MTTETPEQPNRSPHDAPPRSEPPRILDQLLGDLGASTPVVPPVIPPKAPAPAPAPPPKATPHWTTPPAPPVPAPVRPLDMPVSSVPAVEVLSRARPQSLDTPPSRGRALIVTGIVSVMAVNALLLILLVFMWQDRAHLRVLAMQPDSRTLPAPAAVPEPTPIRSEPSPVAAVAALPALTPQPDPARAAADMLHIPKLVLTRSVTDFANYEPIPNTLLKPHHVHHMLAYVEIAHPKAEARDDDRHVYYMTKSMKLYRSDIGPSEPVMDTAVSLIVSGLSPRRDFHAAQPLQTSRRIEPGEYTLTVSIRDQVSGETTTRETSFVIHPD